MPRLRSANVSSEPAMAKAKLRPAARNHNPIGDARKAAAATVGIIGNTQGESKLKIPAINAMGIALNSMLIFQLC
jgi:hypothetical protein